jgi:hypothetical protein
VRSVVGDRFSGERAIVGAVGLGRVMVTIASVMGRVISRTSHSIVTITPTLKHGFCHDKEAP